MKKTRNHGFRFTAPRFHSTRGNDPSLLRSGIISIPILLRPTVADGVAFGIKLNRNDVRIAADGAILDIFLPTARRWIDLHDDFLATGIADVICFVEHDLRSE